MNRSNFCLFVLCIFGGASGLAKQCGPGEWTCRETGECIPEELYCDGKYDCEDFSDEPGKCAKCSPFQFQCANEECVSANFVCDGKVDCSDGSDERNATTGECPPCPNHLFWQCKDGQCVAQVQVCDHINNCADDSDEDGCTTCWPWEFECDNGNCIRGDGRLNCDRRNDCGDWSDEKEEDCPCSANETRCEVGDDPGPPGACIPPEYICDEDGIRDCPFGDDELNCTRTD